MEIIQQKQYKHIKNKEVENDASEVILERRAKLNEERMSLMKKLAL